MNNAPIVSLADIAELIQYGYTASASDTNVGPKFLRVTDIVPSQINWDEVPYCEIDNQKLAKFSLAQNDIVIARTGTVGYAKLIDNVYEPSVFASYLVRIRIDPDKADPRYVGRIVESDIYKRFILSRVGGVAQPNANAKILSSFLLPIPEKHVQTKISLILSSYDDLIKNNRRRITLLEEATQQLYKEWFVRLRFPNHESVIPIDGIPDGWELRELGELAVVNKGRNITKNTAEEGDVPVVAGGLKPAYFHNTANAKAPVITVSASGANAGHVAIYHEDIWASDCSYLSISDNPYVWFWHAMLKARQPEITAMQQGAAQPHVYPKHLKKIQVLMPPAQLIAEFQKIAKQNFSLIRNLLKQNKQLDKARNLLLPKFVNGEIEI